MSQKFTNAARSVLMAGISAASTSITLDAAKADLFPVADTGTSSIPTAGKDWFKIVLEDNTGAIEIVYVRTRASGAANLTNCLRGQEGTTARAYLAGSIVELRHTAADLADAISFASSATPFWKSMVTWANDALSRTALGISAIGDALFTAASTSQAQDTLGASVIGKAVFTAADAAAARAAIGGSGASGGGSDAAFYENDTLITTSVTVGSAALSACTISIASPAVITMTNDFVADQPVRFETTGALPVGLDVNAQYFVLAAGLSTASFRVSLTPGGAAVNTSGTQSGTHKCGKIKNAVTGGPVTIANGVTVTVPTGSTLTVV